MFRQTSDSERASEREREERDPIIFLPSPKVPKKIESLLDYGNEILPKS